MSQNNQQKTNANNDQTNADAQAANAAANGAVPSTPAARSEKKKYFGAGVVAGIAAGVGGVLAWQRWGGSLTSNG